MTPHKVSADLVWFAIVWVVITNKKGPNSQNALGLKFEEVNPNTGHLKNVEKIYTGLSSNTMKSHYNTHQTTFRHDSYAEETTLAGAVWRLKWQDLNFPYTIEWFPQKLAKAYSRNAKRCDLCWSEKTFILYQDHGKSLNKHKELHRKCLHYERHRLMSW